MQCIVTTLVQASEFLVRNKQLLINQLVIKVINNFINQGKCLMFVHDKVVGPVTL